MRRGCRVSFFGEAKGPVRDNIDDAQRDAVRLKLGHFDVDNRFYLEVGADLEWVPVPSQAAAA